ncbi:DUF2218 domain-containing protein [Pseudomonas sp. FME51]|nr:DUF2218 domain-containing protein [Pseudomonas sp. FME51]
MMKNRCRGYQQVVADHLQRMASSEELVIDWQ